MPGPQGVDDSDHHVRAHEREVVVATVPDDDVGLLLRGTEDALVVHARVHDHAHLDGRLVLLALLDGGVAGIDVGQRREPLDSHRLEIAVGHGVPDEGHAQSRIEQQPPHGARRLALAAAGAHGADPHDRLGAAKHRRGRARQPEVRTGCHHDRRPVHHVDVGDVGVGEDHFIDLCLADQCDQLLLRHDRDPVRVQRASQGCGVGAIIDPGDLGRGERHHPTGGVVAEDRREDVEIPATGTHDHDVAHVAILDHCPERMRASRPSRPASVPPGVLLSARSPARRPGLGGSTSWPGMNRGP